MAAQKSRAAGDDRAPRSGSAARLHPCFPSPGIHAAVGADAAARCVPRFICTAPANVRASHDTLHRKRTHVHTLCVKKTCVHDRTWHSHPAVTRVWRLRKPFSAARVNILGRESVPAFASGGGGTSLCCRRSKAKNRVGDPVLRASLRLSNCLRKLAQISHYRAFCLIQSALASRCALPRGEQRLRFLAILEGFRDRWMHVGAA